MEMSLKFFLILWVFLALLFLITFSIGNERIFLFINKGIAHSVLDFIVLYVFNPLFFLLGIVPFLMVFSKKDRFLGIFALILGFLCYFIGHLMKVLFAIPRPYEFLPARLFGPWHTSSFSFPSTTTMLAFGLALPILLKKPRLGSFLLVLAFLVGFSVIYTGFHTLYDVLAGILISSLLVFLFKKILSKNGK
jgi:undecaprenyl-diphosphatase